MAAFPLFLCRLGALVRIPGMPTVRKGRTALFLVVLLALSAAPTAAGTIVGEFFFQRDVCDPLDEFCQPFEYFNLTNTVDPGGSLAGLTFSALIQIDGSDYEEQFFPFAPIGSGEFAITLGLPATPPFAGSGSASLLFTGGNVADYFGTLSLSNLLSDDGSSSPPFSAQVVFTESGPVAVTEAPSWLVVVLGLGALAVGRVFLASN